MIYGLTWAAIASVFIALAYFAEWIGKVWKELNGSSDE